MAHVIRSSFAVRSYEIDSYSHLNNGVFVAWFEQGRLDHLESLGFSYDGFAGRREWFVVGRLEVDFRRPLRLGEAVAMDSWVEGLGRSSVRYRQVMRLAPEGGGRGDGDAPVVAEAFCVMVFSGEGDGRGAIPIPEDFRQALALADAEADATASSS